MHLPSLFCWATNLILNGVVRGAVLRLCQKSATKRGDGGAKTEVSHWKCFSLAVRSGLADSISKKPQVAGLLFLQVVAGRAFFVGYSGFRARIRLSTCTKRSRKTFASYVPNLGKGMLEQFHQPGLSPLSLDPSVCWKSQNSLGVGG